MTNNVATIPQQKVSLLSHMASKFHIDATQFQRTVLATCFPGGKANNEELAAFLMVANEYNLNPLTKEIYAFPAKGGGIVPIVSVDGWMNLINSKPEFNGMQFEDQLDDNGNLISVTCRIYRKDRSHPIEVTEYMAECARPSVDTWKKWPRRMLRHKAAIQCARYAFGFAGIYDPDEGERIKDVNPIPNKANVKEQARHAAEEAASSVIDSGSIDEAHTKELLGRLEIVAEESGISGLEEEWRKLSNEERAHLSKDFKSIMAKASANVDTETGEVFDE